MLKFRGMLWSFLRGVFTPINCFLFILQNILCKIELFEECRYLFSNLSSTRAITHCSPINRNSPIDILLGFSTLSSNERIWGDPHGILWAVPRPLFITFTF